MKMILGSEVEAEGISQGIGDHLAEIKVVG